MADSRLSATCEIGSTPTGRPPGEKRRSRVTSGSSRRQLFTVGERVESPASSVSLETWSDDENKALVKFVLFYSSPNAWPTYGKTHKYWREAAEYVQLRSSTRVIRTGELIIIAVYNIMCIHVYQRVFFYFIVGACRLRVFSKYPRLFPTPADAERHYWGRGIEAVEAEPQEPFIEAGTQTESVVASDVTTQTSHVLVDASTQSDEANTEQRHHSPTQIVELVRALSLPIQEDLVAQLMCMLARDYGVHLHSDFVGLALKATKHLQQSGRSDVLYGLARALGKMRVDGSDSRLPARRMPMGLLEHIVNFFNADSYSQVRDSTRTMVTCISSGTYLYYRLDRKVSRRLQAVADYHVQPIWKQVGLPPSWPNVECGSC